MAAQKKRVNFYESLDGREVRRKLTAMSQDPAFNTTGGYSANSELYPDNVISFVDKHMSYLNAHPGVDPDHYVANLRLMTRRK